MGTRGPKSSNQKLKVLKPSTPRRPNPLKGMSKPARNIWLRTVKAYQPDHFKPQHYGLLRAYCEAEALHNKAEKEAVLVNYTDTNTKSGVTKESHWVGIMDKMAGRMTALSVKLGISVNNTTVNRGIKGSVTKPKSKRADLLFKDK